MMNRIAYDHLIRDDVQAIEAAMDETLERQHIVEVLKDSARLYYEVEPRLAALIVAEQELSDAYLRIRHIVGSFDTKPGGSDHFELTERLVREAVAKI